MKTFANGLSVEAMNLATLLLATFEGEGCWRCIKVAASEGEDGLLFGMMMLSAVELMMLFAVELMMLSAVEPMMLSAVEPMMLSAVELVMLFAVEQLLGLSFEF